MKCPRCQQENPPQATFCLECATPPAPRCANCGTQLPAGPKFCFECATPVSASRSGPRLASPEAYTPKHLAERIINSTAAVEGGGAENGGSVTQPFVVSTLQLPK
jgi:Double zinc ribbon